MYMDIPKGVDIPGSQKGEYVLQLEKNLCGQKQAGRVWFEHLRKNLKLLGFKEYKIDECVLCFNKSIYGFFNFFFIFFVLFLFFIIIYIKITV